MSVTSDLRILRHMVFGRIRGGTHSERLESYYSAQAADYDDFRRRLLSGRQELFSTLPIPPGGRWLDMGGGTGANLEHLAPRLSQMSEVTIVDLSESLLNVARKRIADRRWTIVPQ